MLANRHGPKRLKKAANADYGIGRRVVFALSVMAVFILGCGNWAATAELAGAVISHGSVVIGRHVKKIQHKEGGIVAAINAKNGDIVARGDSLIRLDDTQARAELGIVQSQLVELRGRLARLSADQEGRKQITFPDNYLQSPGAVAVAEGENRLHAHNIRTRESQKQQLEQKIEQAGEETKGINAQRDAKKSELILIRKELEKVRYLRSQQLTPETRVYSLEREEARIAGEYGNFIALGARLASQIIEIELQILNIEQSARTEAQKESRSIEGRIAELAEREISAKDRLAHLDIRAPDSGVVNQLSIHTIGGVVSPAEPIMFIVPDGDALEIELRIAPNDIDQVFLGQAVRLRFTAFNQRTTPEMQGRVSYISADVTSDPKGRQDFFPVRIALESGQSWKVGEKPILPGMPVEAFVATGQRTALSYMTKPITDQFSRAFRER